MSKLKSLCSVKVWYDNDNFMLNGWFQTGNMILPTETRFVNNMYIRLQFIDVYTELLPRICAICPYSLFNRQLLLSICFFSPAAKHSLKRFIYI